MSEEERLERAIRALEAQRADLGGSVVDTATEQLREKLVQLKTLSSLEERRLVTILFADVSGFTALSERTDPEEVQGLLTRLWRRLDRTITLHHGHIDKHIGDAVMAVWGLGETGTENAANAVRAGLALQQEIARFREEERVELALRVGINTGLSSVAKLESTGEASIIGDAVNVASRLEHSAPLGGVLIGPLTREHVLDAFDLGDPEALALKGKREPVLARLVLGERAARRPAKTLRSDEVALVGRRKELTALLAACRAGAAGPSQFALLVGEAGSGKSRCMAELLLWVVKSGETFDVLHVAATRDLTEEPLGFLRRLVTRLAGEREGSSPEVLRESFLHAFSAVLGETAGVEACTYLSHLFGLVVDEKLRGLSHRVEQIRARAEILLTDYLKLRVAKCPLVVLVDDLHFADESSLDFLAALEATEHLAVVASVRPGHNRIHARFPFAKHVMLGAFSREECLDLARGLLTPIMGPPAAHLVELVANQCGGNPYFAQELVRWLWERDFRVARSPADLPPRIELLLHERLQRLPHETRRVLSAASVIGASGTAAALNALCERSVSSDLDALEMAEVVVQGPEGWAFRHVLLRDVVYEYTLLRERRAQHGLHARWLVSAEAASPTVIARHFEAAEEPVEAARHWGLAGEAARQADAPDEAIQAFEHALKLLERSSASMSELPLVVRCYEGLALCRERRASHTAALEAFERMLWAANAASDGLSTARAHNGMAWVSSQRGDHARALEHAKNGEQAALSTLATSERGRHRLAGIELARALHDQAWALQLLGRAESAREIGERSLLAAAQHNAPAQRALALNAIGCVEFTLLTELDQGIQHTREALALYRQLGDLWGIACLLNNLGFYANECRQLVLAKQHLDETLSVARQIGDRGLEIMAFTNLAQTQLLSGDPRGSEQTLQKAIALIEEGDQSFALSEIHRTLARALDVDGRPEEALVAAENAVAHAPDPGSLDAALAWRVLGEILGSRPTLRSHVSTGAEECFAKSLSGFVALGLEHEQAATQEAWARFEESRLETARAAELRESASKLAKKPTTRLDLSTTLRLPR
jgi:class 3 adenylate cyclase/tetratricopeptide (TPR) repeat protein